MLNKEKCQIGAPAFKGLMDIWILSLLSKKEMNGYEILKSIAEITKGHWEPKSGSVYPELHKLKKKGLIELKKKGARHQIVYKLTPFGKQRVLELRNTLKDFETTRRLTTMIEALIWPDESEEMRDAIHSLYEKISKIRNSDMPEKEKIKKIKKACQSIDFV